MLNIPYREYQERNGLLFIVMEKAERDLGSMMRMEKLKKFKIQVFWEDMLRAVQVRKEKSYVIVCHCLFYFLGSS